MRILVFAVTSALILSLVTGSEPVPDHRGEGSVLSSHAGAGHSDPVTSVLLGLIVILGSAKIILGAALIDDVLGLPVLAVVEDVVVSAETGSAMVLLSLLKIAGMAVGFLVGALLVGQWLVPKILKAVCTGPHAYIVVLRKPSMTHMAWQPAGSVACPRSAHSPGRFSRRT